MEMEMEKALEKEGWHLLSGAAFAIVDTLSGERSGGEEFGHGLERLLREKLLDSDLKDIGAACLPEPQTLRHMRRLRGPLVLQIAAIDDVGESKAMNAGKSQNRLLRIKLTDGHTSVSAIEYQPISKISLDIPPGTKVRISDTTVHSGLLFLDENVISVLGGHVQTLYDAWKIERRYSGLVRATIKGSSLEDVSGPPPFRELSKTLSGAETHPSMNQRQAQADSKSGSSTSHDDRNPVGVKVRAGLEPYRPRRTHDSIRNQGVPNDKGEVAELQVESNQRMCMISQSGDHRPKVTENKEELASTSQSILAVEPTLLHTAQLDDGRSPQTFLEKKIDLKESVVAQSTEVLPVQNRMAAQKLLEKKVQLDPSSRGRGGNYGSSMMRNRGRGRRGGRRAGNDDTEDPAVFTLDEWEARQRAASASLNTAAGSGASSFYWSDEALARRLQLELELESQQETAAKKLDESEQLRLSMFKFPVEKMEGSSHQRTRGRRGGRRQHL